MIELKGVTKGFEVFSSPRARLLASLRLPIGGATRQEFVAVQDISFTVNPGERVGLVGRNGAGKSTLLKMVAGLLRPTAGELTVRGQVQALLELGTGFHPEFTGRENVYASLAYQGVAGTSADRAFDDVLDFSELDEFIERPVKTYSAGMYARLAFATATAVRPEVLIVDEILGAGDAYFAQKSSQRMATLTGEGTTLLFVSHDISAVQMMCDRAIWIDRGRVVADGPPHEVSRKYAASIRRQAEMRLKAENFKLLRAQVESFDGAEGSEPLVCRFIGADGAAPSRLRIRSIGALTGDGVDLEPLVVGSARDNDVDEPIHLLTATGFMNWSEQLRDGRGPYREIGDFGGVYAHAPFSLKRRHGTIAGHSVDEVTIEVVHDGTPQAEILVQQHTADGYRTIATIGPGSPPATRGRLVAESAVASALVEEALFDIDARYGSDPSAVRAVRFSGDDGVPRFVFDMGEAMNIEIDLDLSDEVTTPVAVVAMYSMDGRCASQVWSPRMPGFAGGATITARFDPLRVGRGDYLVSVGVFDGLDDDEPAADPVCVLDRSFKVRIGYASGWRIERGAALQEALFDVELQDG